MLFEHVADKLKIASYSITVQVEIFEVFLISCFSWVVDDTKIIHVEGGITIPAKFSK